MAEMTSSAARSEALSLTCPARLLTGVGSRPRSARSLRTGSSLVERGALALEIVAELNAAKASEQRGMSTDEMAVRLRVELSELRQVLEVLQSLDWTGRLTEQNDKGQARHVILIDPSQVIVAPLADRLLVLRVAGADRVWGQTGLGLSDPFLRGNNRFPRQNSPIFRPLK